MKIIMKINVLNVFNPVKNAHRYFYANHVLKNFIYTMDFVEVIVQEDIIITLIIEFVPNVLQLCIAYHAFLLLNVNHVNKIIY